MTVPCVDIKEVATTNSKASAPEYNESSPCPA